jgi:hypothetical protein
MSTNTPALRPLSTSTCPLSSKQVPIYPQNAKKQKTIKEITTSKAIKLAVGLLEDEYKLKEIAFKEFPLDITSLQIQALISKYKDKMLLERSICSSYRRFIAIIKVYLVLESNKVLLLLEDNLDQYSHCVDS